MIEEMTGIPSTTAYQILVDDLGKKRFVPGLFLTFSPMIKSLPELSTVWT